MVAAIEVLRAHGTAIMGVVVSGWSSSAYGYTTEITTIEGGAFIDNLKWGKKLGSEAAIENSAEVRFVSRNSSAATLGYVHKTTPLPRRACSQRRFKGCCILLTTFERLRDSTAVLDAAPNQRISSCPCTIDAGFSRFLGYIHRRMSVRQDLLLPNCS